VWYLGATDFAPSFRRFALDLIDAGVGDWPTVSNELTVACMASLLGDHDETERYFQAAREKLIPNAQEPQSAIIDFDQAVALANRGDEERNRALHLLERSLATFQRLEMRGWEKRALAEALRHNRLPRDRSAAIRASAPSEGTE
jgi:hypothetical protein